MKLTRELIFNTIINKGSGYFTNDQLAESEVFTLFAEDVTDTLLQEQDK